MDLNQTVSLDTVLNFRRVKSLENYEGMLGTLTEDDPKVAQFIANADPTFIVYFERLDVDTGPATLKIQDQGKRPSITVRRNSETISIPVPEKDTPPLSWQYKKIGERLIYDLGSLLMCDIVRIGRYPFNHFHPVLKSGDLDLMVSREHALVIFYKGGLHYVDYGSLVQGENRKEGSTNGTYLSNGDKIKNCMHEWPQNEPLEFGQLVEVISGGKRVNKRLFRVIYHKINKGDMVGSSAKKTLTST